MTSIKILLGALMCLNLGWGYINSTATKDVPKTKHQYMIGNIAHINGLTISFENGGPLDTLMFPNEDALEQWREDQSVYDTCIHGYKDDLDFLVRQGYVWVRTVYNADEQYSELVYDGPNWMVDGNKDTSYIITTFNTVEKIYNPTTKSFEFDSYSID